MREWRKTHFQSSYQIARAKVRAHSRILELRGNLTKQPCQFCGDPKSERHHPEELNPFKVIYLCRGHHLLHHQNLINISHLVPHEAVFKKRHHLRRRGSSESNAHISNRKRQH